MRTQSNFWRIATICIITMSIIGIATPDGYAQRAADGQTNDYAPTDSCEKYFSSQEEPEDYEYPELLTEGKSWVVWHGLAYEKQFGFHIENDYLFYISVDGEDTIDGIPCKRLKYISQALNDFCPDCYSYPAGISEPKYYYGYERDRKIYIYRDPGYYFERIYDENGVLISKTRKIKDPYFDLYMDLNIDLGDNINDIGFIENIEYREIGGKIRKVYSSYMSDFPYLNCERNWMEGIGSNCLSSDWTIYTYSLITGSHSQTRGDSSDIHFRRFNEYLMVMCCENGVPIYDNRATMLDYGFDLSMISSEMSGVQNIHDPLTTENQNSKIYNLQGLEVTNPQKGQIYIRDGKKFLLTEK